MPVFQVSTKSRNGVRWTMPRGEIEDVQQPELRRLIERADDRRRDQPEAGERAVEIAGAHVTPPPSRIASHSRSACASRGVTSG